MSHQLESRGVTGATGAKSAGAPAHGERAVERALSFLEAQRLPDRKTADGRAIGIQATILLGALSSEGIELGSIFDGSESELARMLEARFGFALEPEHFSNMLFVATLGASRLDPLRRLSTALLDTFKHANVDGLYHFFASLRFACDLDCTGVAARARLVSGDIDPSTATGAAELRCITQRILKSAAVADVSAAENRSHGKDNGRLRKHVFKVYPDDHDVQGSECDRGLKNNPVVVANALYAVLFELRSGLRSADETIHLVEYVEGVDTPRRGEATVAEIVAANIGYLTAYLLSGDYWRGCRYYASPDAFLCFFSESLHEFPEMFAGAEARAGLRDAIAARRRVQSSEPAFDSKTSLNAAFRVIAAENVAMDATVDRQLLVSAQSEDGAWRDLDAFYSLGTAREVHFRSTLLTTAFALRALLRGR